MTRLVALVAVVALVATPAPALAQQGNPFAPPPVPEQPIVPPSAPAPEQPGGDDFSSGEMALVALALLLGLTALGALIIRDARRRVPRRDRRHTAVSDPDGTGARRGTRAAPRGRKPSPAERKRRKRGRAR